MPHAADPAVMFSSSAFGFEDVNAGHVGTTLVRLAVAFALGAFVSYRPWRRFIRRRPRAMPPSRESAEAQTLIAVAGALMVAVIGDSVARAFGLVGLGAFIRFRSGIKDPRDAAVMFVMIGIGMACGLGSVAMAVIATAFCSTVLLVFDVSAGKRQRVVRVAVTVDQPRSAYPTLRGAFPEARVIEMPNSNPEVGRVVFEAAVDEDADAASILEQLEGQDLHGIRNVTLEEGKAA